MTARERIVDDAIAYGELAFWTIFLGIMLVANLPYEYMYLPLKARLKGKR